MSAGIRAHLGMAFPHKTVLMFATIAVALLGVLVFVVPKLINVDRYRPEVIAYLGRKTGKQIEIGNLALSFSPLSIRVDRFGAKNPPLFPPGYIVQVSQINAKIDATALLHRHVVIKELVLDRPVIHLVSDPDGPWNFENPQMKAVGQMFPQGPIAKVQINNGAVMVSNLLPSDAPGPVLFEAHGISSELADVNVDAILDPTSSSVDGQGTLIANDLRFGAIQATNVHAKIKLMERQAIFGDVTAKLYGGNAKGDLVFKLSGNRPSFAS